MAVKIRKSSEITCMSCKTREVTQIYDIGFSAKQNNMVIVQLCDGCMHELLQKLIIIGSKHSGN